MRNVVSTFKDDAEGLLLWIVLGLEDTYEDLQGVKHSLLKLGATNAGHSPVKNSEVVRTS